MRLDVVNGSVLLALKQMRGYGRGVFAYKSNGKNGNIGFFPLLYRQNITRHMRAMLRYHAYGILYEKIFRERPIHGSTALLWKVNPIGVECHTFTLSVLLPRRIA